MHQKFDLHHVIHKLKHLLPAKAPLMDFVHHNTLHSFQHLPFHEALQNAHEKLGYQVYLSLPEFRDLYQKGRIDQAILRRMVEEKKGPETEIWIGKMLYGAYELEHAPRVGALRGQWKKLNHIDLDSIVHPTLFRLLGSFLDLFGIFQ